MRRFALLAAALVLAAGCQTDSTGPTASVAGTYQLSVINGQRLPYTFTDNDGFLEQLNQDVLTMTADGSYQDVAYLSDNTGSFQRVETGQYSSINGSITFYDQTDGIQYGGSLTGTTLTEISGNGSVTEVFQRQ
jgi:hypothetical protein